MFEPHSERASQAIEKHKSRLQTSKEAGILETVAHFYWQILVCDYTCQLLRQHEKLRIGHLFTHKNRGFSDVAVTERNCPASILGWIVTHWRGFCDRCIYSNRVAFLCIEIKRYLLYRQPQSATNPADSGEHRKWPN